MAQSGPALSLSNLEEGKYVSRSHPDNAPEHVNPADILIEQTLLSWDISPDISNTSLPRNFSYSDTSSASFHLENSSDGSQDVVGAVAQLVFGKNERALEVNNNVTIGQVY